MPSIRRITVHHSAHLPRRQKQVLPVRLSDNEAVTVAMTDHPAGNEFHAVAQAEHPLSIPNKFTIAFEHRQHVFELVAFEPARATPGRARHICEQLSFAERCW